MSIYDEWLKRQGSFEHTPIQLTNVDEKIARKATLIDTIYIQILGSKRFNRDWEIAESAVVNLRDVTEVPELTKFKLTQQPICEAVIQAFNVETGLFPSGFDPKTGQYQE